jgi:hypothetical protein
MEVDEYFIRAVNDYFYLTQRGYPVKGFLMLVGNRYGLNSIQRSILYRGIASDGDNKRRMKKLITTIEIENQHFYIDGFNVLTTIASYLLGKVVFISSDGILRDASVLKGKLTFSSKMAEAVMLLHQYLFRFP